MEKKTCLYDRHVALGALMSPFGGFIMPIQYSNITDEHNAVRQRITLLKDYTTLECVDDLKSMVRSTLCDGERLLTADEVAAIETIEATYLKEEFIHLL